MGTQRCNSKGGEGHCLTLTQDSHNMTVSNISSKVTGPIITIFLEPPGAEGMKICPNRSDHMSSMATTPIHGKKTFKNLQL